MVVDPFDLIQEKVEEIEDELIGRIQLVDLTL